MIQLQLAALLRQAIERAQATGVLPAFDVPPIEIERPARKEHGDWSSGVALGLARAAAKPPRAVADAIVTALGQLEHVAKIEVAGPGFINFTLSHAWLTNIVREVQEAGDTWGHSRAAEPERIQIEFVSANPTGPMHLGHGRWAAMGDTLARLIQAAGHEVHREFYINDHGTQMEKFGASVAARYLELQGRTAEIPEGGYKGADIKDVAAEIFVEVGDRFLDVSEAERNEFMRVEGQRRVLVRQRQTLERFGVEFDVWFSERSLHEAGAVQKVVELLTELGHTYEQDGALWLRTTDFGDDKDRVIVRSTDAKATYRVPDLAYFLDKIRRGYQRLIYLLGADHHGAVRTLTAMIRAIGEDPEHCEFLLGQWVSASRHGRPVTLSKRTGESITFDELIDEVGVDAARYHYLRIGMDQAVTLDLDLIVQRTQENPVFYVQYAHARICSILRHAAEQGVALAPVDEVVLEELQHESELDLLRKIAELPEAVEVAARLRAPHRMTRFAEELSALFHGFYRDCRVVSDDASVTQARLHLVRAVGIALKNVLTLIGVSAPEKM